MVKRGEDQSGTTACGALHLGVYTDYPYHEIEGQVFAERAFAKFVGRLAPAFSKLTVIGRLDPTPDRARYRLSDEVGFIPLPHYPRLTDVPAVLAAIIGTIRSYWRALEDLDVVWLLGPHPFAFVFTIIARARRRKVVLGVRQDSIEYMRTRHPGKPVRLCLALVMEACFRLMARRFGVIAVGPDIAARYGRRTPVLQISVSLIEKVDIVDPVVALEKDYSGKLTALSVGRIEQEKNPLLMAEVLARLAKGDGGWQLVVCGEGSMEDELRLRMDGLGVGERAEMRGYVPIDRGLMDLYQDAHAFLHVSWTEGLPQTLIEALANGLPAVATDVGGIRAALGEALLLVPPDDAKAAAYALEQIATDSALRRRLVTNGLALAATMTIEQEVERVAEFMHKRARPELTSFSRQSSDVT